VAGNNALAVFAIGVIALIAGVGRLVQHYIDGTGQDDPVPVPVFVAAALFGSAVVLMTSRAAARDFLKVHTNLRAWHLWLAAALIVAILGLTYVAGATNAVRRE
jgi:hypothetical protein